jgi:DNA-binding NarL/FixJ family response regulator
VLCSIVNWGALVKRSGSLKVQQDLHAAKSVRPARKSQTPADISILVADHNPIDRAGLIALLKTQPDFHVVGEASTTEEAMIGCRKHSPSVAVLTLRLPGLMGRTALSQLRKSAPKVPVLAIAERGEGECMVLNPPRTGRVPAESHAGCTTGTDCLELAVAEGATGTIRRSAHPEELFNAIRTVALGNSWYEAATATAIMRHALSLKETDARRSLSARETEVAELIAGGRSNKEISVALGISEPTVKKHVGHVLAKLKLQDRLQIGLYVVRNPLILGLRE